MASCPLRVDRCTFVHQAFGTTAVALVEVVILSVGSSGSENNSFLLIFYFLYRLVLI